jgi:putative ABC transport system permease protein
LKIAGPNASVAKKDVSAVRLLTSAQLAFTLALLVGAGLLLRTTYNLSVIEPGYDTHNVLTMLVTVVDGNEVDFHRAALQRVQSLPGVTAAAFAWGVPLTGSQSAGRVSFEGHTCADVASWRSVTPWVHSSRRFSGWFYSTASG